MKEDTKQWNVDACKEALKRAKEMKGKPAKVKHHINRAERRLQLALEAEGKK